MKRIRIAFVLLTAVYTLLGIESMAEAVTGNTYKVPAYHQPEEEAVTTTKKGVKYTYEFRDSKKTSIDIVKIENVKEKLVIPAKLDGYPVYKITGPEFGSVVKTVIIENGVKEIGAGAFSYQKQLHSVTIPKSVKIIYSEAFKDDIKLEKIRFRNSAVKIGDRAFNRCSKLQKVFFSQGEFTGKIGEDVFNLCDIRSIKLPYMKKMQKQIGHFAFAENKKLKKVTFSSKQKKVSLGLGWFTDCPKAQIVVGKKAKTFSSKVNANAGTVRLLGRQTKLIGFKNPKDRSYYYIQFKKFIVPKKSKAIPVLRNAKYGTVSDSYVDRYRGNSYFSTSEADMHKVKVVIK